MVQVDNATKCTGGPQPGAVALRNTLLKLFPEGHHSGGIYNCRKIAGSSRLSTHAEGRAYDAMATKATGDAIAAWARANAEELGIQRVLWWQKDHYDHVHIELNWWGALNAQNHPLLSGAGTGPLPTPAVSTLDDYHALGRGAIIKQGSRGEAVRHVQGLLHHFGIDAGPVDGIFGPKTAAAVKEFQRRAGIGVDGIVGAQTYTQLEDCYYSRGKFAPAAVPSFPGTVRRGSRGDAVRAVQQRLADRGWRIAVDGVYGPQTEAVVRKFQAEKGLSPDGVAGPLTWTALWTAPVT